MKFAYGESCPQKLEQMLEEREEVVKELRKIMIDSRVNKESLNLPQVCSSLEQLREMSLSIV